MSCRIGYSFGYITKEKRKRLGQNKIFFGKIQIIYLCCNCGDAFDHGLFLRLLFVPDPSPGGSEYLLHPWARHHRREGALPGSLRAQRTAYLFYARLWGADRPDFLYRHLFSGGRLFRRYAILYV